jgi:hypothetical protein
MAAMGGDAWDDANMSGPDVVRSLIARYGSQRRAAAALDVPRRTLRGWADGKTPRGGGQWLRDIAREGAREAAHREAGDRRADRLPTATGGAMRGAEDRTVPIGDYLRSGTVDRVRDLYLGGADAEDLARAFHAGIDDAGFYESTFDPDSQAGGWDIEWIDLDDLEIGGTYLYE